MLPRRYVEYWNHYAATAIVADCSTCKARFTLVQLDRLAQVSAGTWRCSCGGAIEMRDEDRLEREDIDARSFGGRHTN